MCMCVRWGRGWGEVEASFTYVLSCICIRPGHCTNKTGLNIPVVFLHAVSRRFLSQFVFTCALVVSYMVFVLFLKSPSFGVSGRLCFVMVAFPGYLHLYFTGPLCGRNMCLLFGSASELRLRFRTSKNCKVFYSHSKAAPLLFSSPSFLAYREGRTLRLWLFLKQKRLGLSNDNTQWHICYIDIHHNSL